MVKTSQPVAVVPGPTEVALTEDFEIVAARVDEPDVAELIARHFALMRAQSPAESCHVLSAAELAKPHVRLLALRQDQTALAIGALKITGSAGEVKSMHTRAEARGKGMGRAVLRALIGLARDEGLYRLDLETGSGAEHKAARAFYGSEGFVPCPPFGNYRTDPLSVFMTRAI